VLLALLGFPRRPAVLDDLLSASDSEGSRWDVLGDRGSCSDVGALANRDWGDEARVRADERSIADLGLVLVDAVVVARDRAGADTFDSRPIVDFLSSTKLPIFAFGPTCANGRRWQNGPKVAASSIADSRTTQ
jgi:hypothetical protein